MLAGVNTISSAKPLLSTKYSFIMQKFDEFLDEYLNEQDETVRSEYEEAKKELLELLEK